MSRLRELMEELCPDGVEYKALGDIALLEDYVANGSFATLKKNVTYLDHPDHAILVRVADYSSGFDPSKFRYVDKHAYEFLKKSSLNAGDIVVSSVGSIGVVFECPDLGQPMTLGPNSIVVKSELSRYLLHYLRSHNGQALLHGLSGQGTLPKINKTQLRKARVPVPPIEVQREIVRILGSFQELDDALTAEIEARERQLSECVDTQICSASICFTGKLSDTCKLIADCPHSTAPDEGVGIPLIRTPNIGRGYLDLTGVHRVSEEVYRQRISRAVPQKDDLILAREGTAGNVAIIPDNTTVCLGQRTVLLRPDPSKVLPPFLCFYMNSDTVRTALLGQAAGSTVSHINLSDIRSFTVRIPDMSTQEVLVERFLQLQDYLFCLQREKRLRRKQFDYYRDRLLSFPEKEV